MVKSEALIKLRMLEPALRAIGADALFLFGSTARGDERGDSDIDVLLDVGSHASFTLLDVAAAQRLLSDGMRSAVDLTMLDDLSAPTRQVILTEAVRVF